MLSRWLNMCRERYVFGTSQCSPGISMKSANPRLNLISVFFGTFSFSCRVKVVTLSKPVLTFLSPTFSPVLNSSMNALQNDVDFSYCEIGMTANVCPVYFFTSSNCVRIPVLYFTFNLTGLICAMCGNQTC